MKKAVFLFVFGSVFLAGCPKHEIIPAPTPKVELTGHLEGMINGTEVEFTQNVSGYAVEATKAKIILSPPNPSSAVYYAEMKSNESLVAVKIGMGSINWDASASADGPALNQFNSFFTTPANLEPLYSNGALSGFEVTYRDGSGNIWKSEETDPNDVIFTNVIQESDGSGDYSKFKCTFSCIVRRDQINPSPLPPTPLQMPLDNIVFEGWFQR